MPKPIDLGSNDRSIIRRNHNPLNRLHGMGFCAGGVPPLDANGNYVEGEIDCIIVPDARPTVSLLVDDQTDACCKDTNESPHQDRTKVVLLREVIEQKNRRAPQGRQIEQLSNIHPQRTSVPPPNLTPEQLRQIGRQLQENDSQ